MIPNSNSALYDWADNFSTLLTANPTNFGLVAGNASTVAGVVTAYKNAYDAASDKGTRTKALVAARDAAKHAMLIVIRPFARMISCDVAVTDENKVAIGLHIPDVTPTRVQVPASAPTVALTDSVSCGQTIKLHDDTAQPKSNRRLPGAIGAEIWADIGTTATSDPSTAKYVGLQTRSRRAFAFPGNSGKIVTWYARWINDRGEVGPWSLAVSAALM